MYNINIPCYWFCLQFNFNLSRQQQNLSLSLANSSTIFIVLCLLVLVLFFSRPRLKTNFPITMHDCILRKFQNIFYLNVYCCLTQFHIFGGGQQGEMHHHDFILIFCVVGVGLSHTFTKYTSSTISVLAVFLHIFVDVCIYQDIFLFCNILSIAILSNLAIISLLVIYIIQMEFQDLTHK